MAEEAITAVIAGRTLTLRQPTAAQTLLLHRATRATRSTFDAFEASQDEGSRNNLASKGLVAAGGILDVLERLVVSGDDRDWLSEQILEGTVDLNDLLVIIQALNTEPDEPEKKPTKKAARRAAAQ